MYIGVTADLKKRIAHKEGHGSRFTNAYNLKDLMYYEGFPTITEAIAREKRLKKWHSAWKWNLIKAHNPSLKDLSDRCLGLSEK